jgi:1-deoxy-D-xylulose-5-phosphate reductoisomerase
MTAPKEIIILGSTGSIGVQALEVVEANPEKFRVIGLSAGGNNCELLIEQAERFKVPIVAVSSNGAKARELAQIASQNTAGKIEVIDGESASTELSAYSCDILLNGITGSIGLAPTLAALAAGNIIALANKESLVAGGNLVTAFGLDRLLPVDSEHSALYQCFLAGKKSEVKRAILTASGGAFRDRIDLRDVRVEEALAHPTWTMGPVVTINSATLVNKGLEIIEAHYLFDIPYDRIDAVIHPQSVVHSMVEFVDGSTIVQASPPNMKGPIAYALGYPDRIPKATAPIDWSTSQSWGFSPIDEERFPAINLARHCGSRGGGLPAIYNAANEIAVDAFIKGLLPFVDIVEIVAKVANKLDAIGGHAPRDYADVSAIEDDARTLARTFISESS